MLKLPVLIGDKVVAKTGSGFTFEGQTGVVRSSRMMSETMEHEVVFQKRTPTKEMIEENIKIDPMEHICWFMVDELDSPK